MIRIILQLFFLVWPLGHLLTLSFPGGFHISPLDLFGVLLSLLLLAKHRQAISRHPLFSPVLFLLLTFLTSLLISGGSTAQYAHLARYLVSFTFFFALTTTSIKPYYAFISLTSFILLGLLQYFLLPDVRFLKYLGFDDHYYRLVGPLLDPNFTGLLLAQISLIGLSLLPPRFKLLSLIPLFALSLTFSRVSYLAFLIGLAYLFFTLARRHRPIALLLVGALLIFISLIPKPFGEGVNLLRTFSITSRIQTQQLALDLFYQRPLFGWGFAAPHQPDLSVYPDRSGGIDNSFLVVLANTGLIGFAAFVYFLISLWRLARPQPLLRALLIVLFIHSLANNSLFYLFENLFLFACFYFLKLIKATRSPAAVAR